MEKLLFKFKMLSIYEWMYNNITILFLILIIAVLFLIFSLIEAKMLYDIQKEINNKKYEKHK